MPPDLRAHTRYPETLFSVQAEMYRTFHMREPEAFYNRADLWDLAKTSRTDQGTGSVSPTYVVATLPGSNVSEFLLMTTFTPANKNNLIAVMYARCDGSHLGEIEFEQLSKQNIIYGPIQIDARINQDQNISKDLSLWNQQGSQVIRGQTLVLPLDNSFLYVEPIYIQSAQASMPQLRKVALAMGNKLAYADTYEQALTAIDRRVEWHRVRHTGHRRPTAADCCRTTPVAPTRNRYAPEDTRALRTLQGIKLAGQMGRCGQRTRRNSAASAQVVLTALNRLSLSRSGGLRSHREYRETRPQCRRPAA